MKNQLIFAGLLMMSVVLVGMEKATPTVSAEEAAKFIGLVEKGLRKSKQEQFSKFNSVALAYFAESENKGKKAAILEFLKNLLPSIITYAEDKKEVSPYDLIDTFLTQEHIFFIVLNNMNNALNLFGAIYLIYLRKHPDELCGVLLNYFENADLIQNPYYRVFMGIMLTRLNAYVNGQLDHYPSKENVNYKALSDPISIVHEYVKNFGPGSDASFDKHKSIMKLICNALDDAESVPKPVSISPVTQEMPLSEPLKSQEPINQPESNVAQILSSSSSSQPTYLPESEKKSPEVKPETTTPPASAVLEPQQGPIVSAESSGWSVGKAISSFLWGIYESIGNYFSFRWQ